MSELGIHVFVMTMSLFDSDLWSTKHIKNRQSSMVKILSFQSNFYNFKHLKTYIHKQWKLS